MTDMCSIDGCKKPKYLRGWCTKHYQRWRRNGSPLKVMCALKSDSLAQRLNSNLKETDGGCLEWQRATRTGGYGIIWVGEERRSVSTHRLAWELANGPIPDGMYVCHKCDNPPCCNPDHLFLGTAKDNAYDMISKGRMLTGGNHGSSKVPDHVVTEAIKRKNSGWKIKDVHDWVVGNGYNITYELVSKWGRKSRINQIPVAPQ